MSDTASARVVTEDTGFLFSTVNDARSVNGCDINKWSEDPDKLAFAHIMK